MKIGPKDIVSGEFYLKLVRDYKAYDERQKQIMANYQKKIELLEWEVENLKECLEEAESGSREKLLKKLSGQRTVIKDYLILIRKLKIENEQLKCELMKKSADIVGKSNE